MTGTVSLTLGALHDLALTTLRRIGLNAAQAVAVADTLVAGERDGCASHGIYRLLVAARSVRTGVVVRDAVPAVTRPAGSLIRVDGGGGFAQPAFAAGLPLLVEAARAQGIAALALADVVHFAALWPEVEALADQGLAAMAMTANHAWVAPAGGTRPVFGTNPFAFAWPRPGRPPFVFDFATSVVARGEIELRDRSGEPVPDDWGYDAAGRATTDPAAVLAGAMRTFGGHKGSALAAMIELMAGPLLGQPTSIASLAADAGRGGSPIGGELIVAFDPALLAGPAAAPAMAAAEALFAAIEAQGARLPAARRHAARRRSLATGTVTIPAVLHAELQALGQAA